MTSRPFDPESAALAWERLRLALVAAGLGTWHVDLRTGVATHDENFNRILGVGAIETTGSLDDPSFTQTHPDDRGRVSEAIATAIADRTEYNLEYRVIRRDGAIRWLRDRGRVILDDGGGVALFAAGALMDVTEQRRIEDSERMLAAVTQALATSASHDQMLAEIVAMLTPGFADACAIHLQDAAVTSPVAAGRDDVQPDERQATEVTHTGVPACTAHSMVLPLRAGGQVIGAIAFGSAGREFDAQDVALASELAGRIALSVDRARLFRDLQQANRVKDEFLATLSHELRTPLNAVLGWTRMLRSGLVPPERTASVLDTIERNAVAQGELVEELLDLSAITSGGLRLAVSRVDLRDLIGGAVETVRPAADAKTLVVGLTIDESVGEIAADPARLRQVLWNLLSNAVKFTPPGGHIDITVMEGAADVEITVRDRKSTRLNSSHVSESRMPSSA